MSKTDYFQHLGSIKPYSLAYHFEMTLDCFDYSPSKYAPGRLQRWLFSEPEYLGSKKLLPRHIDERVLNLAKHFGFDSNKTIALVTYHGRHRNFQSNACIKPHRDASYAQPKAILINDGGQSTFVLDEPNFKKREIELMPGQAIAFNCKFLHSVTYADPNRYSLVLWQIKKDCTETEPLSKRISEANDIPF